VHSIASGPRNIDALFFILMWAQCASHRKHAGTHFVQLVYLHLVQSAGHIVH
jgi:hypothetical protein